MATHTYASTALLGTTKKGRLKFDPDGYVDVVVGGFDTYNSAGDYYDFASAKASFDSASDFQRRIANGALYGECGHPTMTPGMSKSDWILRILTIDPKNHSHHIKELTLDDTTFKNKDGTPIVAVYARIKPTTDKLAASLENEHENTAFSIRCLTHNHYDARRGCMVRSLSQPVTYDYVIEPGIAIATKYNSPGLEDLTLGGFTDEDIRATIMLAERSLGSMECASVVRQLNHLLDKPKREELVKLSLKAAKLPPSAHWR